eukprot:15260134-Alexandrium_andersonii.AAC.1
MKNARSFRYHARQKRARTPRMGRPTGLRQQGSPSGVSPRGAEAPHGKPVHAHALAHSVCLSLNSR